MEISALEEGLTALLRNARKRLPSNATLYPRREGVSSNQTESKISYVNQTVNNIANETYCNTDTSSINSKILYFYDLRY
jgi:hypothetical protein